MRNSYNAFMVRTVALALALLTLAGCDRRPPPATSLPENYHAQVQAWRDKHEVDYRHDYVPISGLYFLDPGRHAVGSRDGNDIVIDANVPATVGTLTVEGERVRFDAASGVPATQSGQPVAGSVVMKEPGAPPAPELVVNDVRFVIHATGGRVALRVRDPNGAPAKEFRGFSWFPIDSAYRVVGRFVRDDQPKQLQVVNTFNGVDTYSTEGVVEFELHGQTLRLRPFTTRPKRLYFVFRDASSGHETYETARFLYADLQDDGSVVLDFNEAYNPPCAFNKYTTCPLPLKENVLPVKVLAGERAYGAGR